MNSRLKKRRYPIKRVYIIDIFALLCAFFTALYLRYPGEFTTWTELAEGLYVNFFFMVIMAQLATLLIYDANRTTIFLMDPFEMAVQTLKSKMIFMAILILYLFMTQRGGMVSRGFFLGISGFNFIFDYAIRMIYRKWYNVTHPFNDDIKVVKLKAPFPSDRQIMKMLEDTEETEVLIHKHGASDEELERVTAVAERMGVRVYTTLEHHNYEVKRGITTTVNGYVAMPLAVRKNTFKLFGINFAISRTEEAVVHVIRHIGELSGKYICFSNVHTSVMAREDKEYRRVLNGAAYVFPDGNPIVSRQLSRGIIGAERVAGPDFMDHMFRDTRNGNITHYFYGSSQKTLDALKANLEEKYPGIVIKGMYSPPYRELSEEEKEEDIKRINDANADIVWIGLGAPKQEKWMAANKDKVKGVMLGVGAGFDFHAGTIKRAPVWIQKIGFEWLYRLFQDPARLIKRYTITNAKYFFYLALDKMGIQS